MRNGCFCVPGNGRTRRQGTVLGLNLDPSHLMIQGAEPIEAAWALSEKIFYTMAAGRITAELSGDEITEKT